MAETERARPFRHAVREQAVEEGLRAGTRNPELGKAGDVDEADPFARAPAFLADRAEPVGAPEAPLVARRNAGRRKPVGPLPPVALPEHGSGLFVAAMDGAGLGRARRRALLVGIVDGEDVAVGLLVLFDCVALVRVGAEPAGVHGDQVYRRFPAIHPFREEATGPAGRGDAEAEALGEPEVPEAVCRADQRVAVGRVGDGAVHHVLDAGFAEDRHAVDCGFDMGFEPVQVAGKQLLAEIVRHAVHETGGRAHLIRAENQAVALLAKIV